MEMTLKELRRVRGRLVERQIRFGDFAKLAHIDRGDCSGIFTGRRYLGKVRAARLRAAIEVLGLDHDEPDDAA
jgi:hypothetical protein